MAKSININSLEVALSDIMEEYGDVIFKVTNEALGAGEKALIKNLKSASPEKKNPPPSYIKKNYKKNWKGTGKKYKMVRYVGNTTMVPSNGKEMPLSNILEYGSKSPHKGFIKKTYQSSESEIASAIVNEIKKGV